MGSTNLPRLSFYSKIGIFRWFSFVHAKLTKHWVYLWNGGLTEQSFKGNKWSLPNGHFSPQNAKNSYGRHGCLI